MLYEPCWRSFVNSEVRSFGSRQLCSSNIFSSECRAAAAESHGGMIKSFTVRLGQIMRPFQGTLTIFMCYDGETADGSKRTHPEGRKRSTIAWKEVQSSLDSVNVRVHDSAVRKRLLDKHLNTWRKRAQRLRKTIGQIFCEQMRPRREFSGVFVSHLRTN